MQRCMTVCTVLDACLRDVVNTDRNKVLDVRPLVPASGGHVQA